ncbi:MAG: carbohydrate ABC transporter permease [Clostridia bacterium]|nr:carbohydrate ABC transporter permease [Clostridia bacterium]
MKSITKKNSLNKVTHRKVALSRGDKAFKIVTGIILAIIFAAFLYPIWFVIIASVSDPSAVNAGDVILAPKGFELAGYKRLLANPDVYVGYANTLFYTIAGTFLNVAVTVSVAYAVSRRDLKGRTFIMMMFLFTMYFQGGLIPGYLNLRSLGLINTRWVLLTVAMINVSNMIVCRTFFASSIPWELHEAAFIDGANDFQTFFKIALPLSRPILSVLAITYAVGHWNDYFNAMVYLKDRELYPLQLFLREILIKSQLAAAIAEGNSAESIVSAVVEQNTASQLKYALIVVATVPILAIYPFFEKYFEKGFMVGSVKG